MSIDITLPKLVAHFGNVMSIDMTSPNWAVLQWGSMGNSHINCRIQLKFRFWLHKKRGRISCKFQLEIRSNKNWVTVRDNCPRIDVQFNWHTFKKNPNGRTDKRTDRQTNGRTDGPIILCHNFYLGGIIKELSPKSLWQTNIKWTVRWCIIT